MGSSSEFYRNVYGSMATGRSQTRYASSQKGNGFFGRMIRGSVMPLIKSVWPYLKDAALDGVGSLVTELKEGKSLKESASSGLKRTSSNLLDEMSKRVRKRQSGSGVRRRKQVGSGLRKKTRRRSTVRRRKRAARPSGPFPL